MTGTQGTNAGPATPAPGQMTRRPSARSICRHQMKEPLGADVGPGLAFSMDRIALNVHGNADSHIDALCHVIFDGELYNGVAADTVTERPSGQSDETVALNRLSESPRAAGLLTVLALQCSGGWLAARWPAAPGVLRSRRGSAR